MQASRLLLNRGMPDLAASIAKLPCLWGAVWLLLREKDRI